MISSLVSSSMSYSRDNCEPSVLSPVIFWQPGEK
jgi:hypothetical protein